MLKKKSWVFGVTIGLFLVFVVFGCEKKSKKAGTVSGITRIGSIETFETFKLIKRADLLFLLKTKGQIERLWRTEPHDALRKGFHRWIDGIKGKAAEHDYHIYITSALGLSSPRIIGYRGTPVVWTFNRFERIEGEGDFELQIKNGLNMISTEYYQPQTAIWDALYYAIEEYEKLHIRVKSPMEIVFFGDDDGTDQSTVALDTLVNRIKDRIADVRLWAFLLPPRKGDAYETDTNGGRIGQLLDKLEEVQRHATDFSVEIREYFVDVDGTVEVVRDGRGTGERHDFSDLFVNHFGDQVKKRGTGYGPDVFPLRTKVTRGIVKVLLDDEQLDPDRYELRTVTTDVGTQDGKGTQKTLYFLKLKFTPEGGKLLKVYYQ